MEKIVATEKDGTLARESVLLLEVPLITVISVQNLAPLKMRLSEKSDEFSFDSRTSIVELHISNLSYLARNLNFRDIFEGSAIKELRLESLSAKLGFLEDEGGNYKYIGLPAANSF